MSITFHTLAERDLVTFCSGTTDPSSLQERLTKYLETANVLPEWCWLAVDSDATILARHYWWSRAGTSEPFGIDHVSTESHDAAVALIAHARDVLAVDSAFCEITSPIENGDDPSEVRKDLVAVLRDSGFDFEVARVTVERQVATTTPFEVGRLSFRPAHELNEELLVELFQSVADDSLDHAMTTERARFGAPHEARERLRTNRSYPAQADWFAVAFDDRDDPVGYVVPAYAGDFAFIGEIGVAINHRGQGYVDELLAWASGRLAETGTDRIVADTDRANAPMRAAFNRAGYREFRWRDDYRWVRQPR